MIGFVRGRCRYSAVQPSTEIRPLVKIDYVADVLGVSREIVRQLVGDGRLPAIQLVPRGVLRFRPEDVEKLLEPNVGVAA